MGLVPEIQDCSRSGSGRSNEASESRQFATITGPSGDNYVAPFTALVIG